MFHIGDKVRIVQEPAIGGVRGEYEVGDTSTVIAVAYENEGIWYELDVYVYDDDQYLWQDEDLELVESSTIQHQYNIGDKVYTDTPSDFGSPHDIRIVAGIEISHVYEDIDGNILRTGTFPTYNLDSNGGICRAEEYYEDELRPEGAYTLF